MSLFRRAQTTRAYPAAGRAVTGDPARFRRSKTTGARQAGKAAEKWEQADRARTRRGGTFLTKWTR
ncbi:hypothetical protein [Streptomyces olivaceus]|uniref:hypothetical protein n=1 Tax=Streptomyces olivaceus TaxID=47716 RepID=UPI0037BB97EA